MDIQADNQKVSQHQKKLDSNIISDLTHIIMYIFNKQFSLERTPIKAVLRANPSIWSASKRRYHNVVCKHDKRRQIQKLA